MDKLLFLDITRTKRMSFFSLSLVKSVLPFLCCVLIISCNSEKKEEDVKLTPAAAMENFIKSSPVEGAEFFKKSRTTYDFLDKLYEDSIIPSLQYCNYYELKDVCAWLKDTPFYDDVYELCQLTKEEYLQDISDEIIQNIEIEKKAFEESILPAIELEIDSLLEVDVEEIMDGYSGGFLNYQKLNFLFGRESDSFTKMFNEKFDPKKYRKTISKHIQSYLDTISRLQDKYCIVVTGKPFNNKMTIDYPELKVKLSKSTLKYVKEYTSKQTDEMWTDIAKDWVAPAVLATLSGGLSTIYDIGSLAYDIENIDTESIDPDDMVRYVCRSDLSKQVDNYYIKYSLKNVNSKIEESNDKLFVKISQSL